MQENNVIYEITKQIQDKQNLQQDFNNAFNLVVDMFKNKYINKIEAEIQSRIDKMEKEPPKEVVLLNAIKPFLDNSKHDNINNTINVFKKVFAITSFQENLTEQKVKRVDNNKFLIASSLKKCEKEVCEDTSIKKDGVYDIDESCIFGINNNETNCVFDNNILIMMVFLLIILNSL